MEKVKLQYVGIPSDLHQQVKLRAVKKKTTIKQVVAEAVKEYLERNVKA